MSIIKTPWTSQPQSPVEIDWGNPITRGLVSALDALTGTDRVTGKILTRVGNPARSSGRYGVGYVGDNASFGYVTIPQTLGVGVTIVYTANSIARTVNANLLAGLGATSGNQLCGFQFSTSTPNRILLRQTNAGGASIRNYNTFSGAAGVPAVLALSFGDSNATPSRTYWNGVFDDGGTLLDGSSGSNTTFDTFGIGGIKRSTDSGVDVGNNGSLALLFNRVLSAAEIKSISDNPWQIFAPISSKIWIPVTSLVTATPAAKLKLVRTSQPQGPVGIDWGNPITKVLVFAAEANTDLTDVVRNGPASVSGSISRSVGQDGSGLKFASAQCNYGNISLFTGTRLSFQLLCVPTNLTQTSGIINKRVSHLIQDSFSIGFNYGVTTDRLSVQFGNASGTNVAISYDFILSSVWSEKLSNFVVNIDLQAGAGLKVKVWRNGAPLALATFAFDTAVASVFVGSADLLLGRVNTTGSNYLDGSLLAVRAFDRALTDAEIVSLSANPWQIFQPISRQIGFPTVEILGFSIDVISDILTNTSQFYSSDAISQYYRPSADVTAPAWYAHPEGALYPTVSETTSDDTDWIVSPTITGSQGPAVMELDNTLPAGTYTIRVRCSVQGTGQIRALLIDASNTVHGTSSWVTPAASFTTEAFTVTTTGVATRIKLEVQ